MRNRQANGLRKSGRHNPSKVHPLHRFSSHSEGSVTTSTWHTHAGIGRPRDLTRSGQGKSWAVGTETLLGSPLQKQGATQWHAADIHSRVVFIEYPTPVQTIIRTCGCRISQTQNGIRSIQGVHRRGNGDLKSPDNTRTNSWFLLEVDMYKGWYLQLDVD